MTKENLVQRIKGKVGIGTVLVSILGGALFLPAIFGTHNYKKLLNRDQRTKPLYYSISRHDVDQVFRDHDGYRIYFDNEAGKMIEKKYAEDGVIKGRKFIGEKFYSVPLPLIPDTDKFKGLHSAGNIKIYKDLEEGVQGYADVINYKTKAVWHPSARRVKVDAYYVEIHLPKNQGLSPGNETWKTGTIPANTRIYHQPIKEIK